MSRLARDGERHTFPTIRKSVTLMHRDTKLGLALAILVMGFAAALCFPRVSDDPSIQLTLHSARELDTGIRLGQVKTYTDADRPQPRPAEVVESTVTQPTLDQQSGATPVTEVLPAEIELAPVANSQPVEPTPVDPSVHPAEVVVEPEPVVVHHRTYETQVSDTLSGIAYKHFRDSSKWRVIYEANRDVLSTPESLKPGMSLIIPIPEADELSPGTEPSLPVVTAPSAEPATRAAAPAPQPSAPRRRFSPPASRLGANPVPRLQ